MVDEGGGDGAAVAVEGVHVEVVLQAEHADRLVLQCNVLSFDASDFVDWMPLVRDASKWSERVETSLNLPPGTF